MFRALFGAAAATLCGAMTAGGAVAAQAPAPHRVAGRVVRLVGNDTVPAPRVRVVLHRVSPAIQGPVDSLSADGAGRFTFRFVPEKGAIYLVSARFGGIEYFGRPIQPDPAAPDTGLMVVVAETSSTAPVSLVERHTVFGSLGANGRSVVEVFVIGNDGQATRIAPDSIRPAWALRLPGGARGVTVVQGDVAIEAVSTRRDSLLVFAPIPPGRKQLAIEYLLPAEQRELSLAYDQPVDTVSVLVEDDAAKVSAPRLAPAPPETIQGKPLRRWAGRMPAGATITVAWPRPGQTTAIGLAVLVGLFAVALGFAGWRFLRTPPVPSAAPGAPSTVTPSATDALLDRIARLDARYRGREQEVTAEEWSRYLAEREQLKRALEAALAGKLSGI